MDTNTQTPARVEAERTHDAHRRTSFLVRATTMLLSSTLDPAAILRQVAELSVPTIADACSIFVAGQGAEVPQLVAEVWQEPEKSSLAAAARERFAAFAEDPSRVARVLRTGKSELHRNVYEDYVRTTLKSDAVVSRMVLSLGIRSALLVPLRGKSGVLGVISLFSVESGRKFDIADLDTAEQLAVSVALAIENARLYQYEQHARTRIQSAADRMQRLQAIMTDLASTLTTEDVAEAIIGHGIAAVGAESGAIWTLDGKQEVLRLLRSSRGDPDAFRLVPLASGVPLADSVRCKEPVFALSVDELRARYPVLAERHPELCGFACLPLMVQGRVTGAISFGFDESTSADGEDRAFLLLVAAYCAQGLYRAQTYEAEQRARAETAVLYGLVDAVNRAKSITDVYKVGLDVVERALDVTRSAILLFDDDGVLRFKADRGLSDRYRRIVEGHSIWPRDARDPFPILVTDTESDPTMEPYRRTFRKEGIRTLGFFPLLHQGGLLGKFIVYASEPRTFTEDQIRLAQAIAGQFSQAVVRKMAETAAERAREDAEHASRMKDEFLAVVSHELRTPLSSIMGWAAILQNDAKRNDANLAKGLAVIERNAKAQATIIEDILDVSRIVRGKLVLDAKPTPLVPVVASALDSLRASAAAKKIELELEAPDPQLSVVGDAERLRQITWNLVSNAIKFTPSGGKVAVRLSRTRGAVVIEVIDSGCGLEPEFLPYVFDRFRQADSSSTRREGGLGLGLSIVRSLAELHGGHVSAQSAGKGQGASFVVTLPVRGAAALSAVSHDVSTSSAPTVALEREAPPRLDGVRVLVVDDQPDAREMLREGLASYGTVVEIAGSVREALELIVDFVPEVVVTDIGMPDEDGYELLRRVRMLHGGTARLPIIALTAYARGEDVSRAEDAGFFRHVAKPVRPQTLAVAIEGALASS